MCLPRNCQPGSTSDCGCLCYPHRSQIDRETHRQGRGAPQPICDSASSQPPSGELRDRQTNTRVRRGPAWSQGGYGTRRPGPRTWRKRFGRSARHAPSYRRAATPLNRLPPKIGFGSCRIRRKRIALPPQNDADRTPGKSNVSRMPGYECLTPRPPAHLSVGSRKLRRSAVWPSTG